MALGIDVPWEIAELRLEIAGLRASRNRLALADDADRREIERALHEGVQQQLVGVAAGLELAIGSAEADPSAVKTMLVDLAHEVQRTLEDTRRLAHRIYPPLLEAGGLGVALRSAAASANVSTRIDVDAGPAYPSHIAGAIYFCCLDVLESAGGGTVSITIRDDGGVLAFEVDADRVLDVEPSLSDRVEALGGSLAIQSGPDHRTRVAGSLPLAG